jgi:hypothetical protein
MDGVRVGDTIASNSSEAYTDRWIAIDEVTQPDAGPLAITELTITNDSDSLAVEMRGQKVDEVTNGNWTQTNCPDGCLLGIASARYTGDPAEVSIETAPGLVHRLTLTAKASTPGSDARLRVVDAVLLGGQTLATYSQEFVPHSLLHPERTIDQGIPNLR